MNIRTYEDIDMVAIEEEARQMRAEAVRYGVARTIAWIKSLFSGTRVAGQHA